MDGHTLLGDIAIYTCTSHDGGPRGYRRRRTPMPERYMPGRFLAQLSPSWKEALTRAVNSTSVPAPWFLRYVVDEQEHRITLPSLPEDRRWARSGRWSL